MRQPILARIMPLIVLGIIFVLFVVGLVLLSYLFIIGALIGLVFFVIAWVKEKFFPSKQVVLHRQNNTHAEHQGRTIDHE